MQRMRSPYLPTFASAASARERSNQTDGTSLAPRASRQMRRVQCVDADGWTKGTLKRSCDFKRPISVADPSSNERTGGGYYSKSLLSASLSRNCTMRPDLEQATAYIRVLLKLSPIQFQIGGIFDEFRSRCPSRFRRDGCLLLSSVFRTGHHFGCVE